MGAKDMLGDKRKASLYTHTHIYSSTSQTRRKGKSGNVSRTVGTCVLFLRDI